MILGKYDVEDSVLVTKVITRDDVRYSLAISRYTLHYLRADGEMRVYDVYIHDERFNAVWPHGETGQSRNGTPFKVTSE